ncbi:TetR/AcrR family transcriptional regulator [Streptomyces sp. NBC_01481]|uniref:TetR/AcrR family transcriptional regulator n=1 Tax=Streptomyces sp. NBC_01481 TaxID=2975869 RepID=UPI00224DBF5C|nr:TetR/AcrR family transcriptional regulator [Streptomyces sp. NBC_01481]MCX4582605.1 TetR/AcrR family transcriptional regulator [Streptomyces sp. NBC_01481]
MPEEPTPPWARRPSISNPRVQRTRARILTVARELLPEVGPTGLTYALLAEQASVTRQTLYRHWPTRAALLFDLILEGPDVAYPEPGDDLRTVATAWLTSLRAGLTDPATRPAVLAVTAQADYDADSAQALTRIGTDRLAALNKLLEPSGRQITADEYTLLFGPVMSRLFFDRRDVTDEFIDAVVTQWLTTVDRTPPPGHDTENTPS